MRRRSADHNVVIRPHSSDKDDFVVAAPRQVRKNDVPLARERPTDIESLSGRRLPAWGGRPEVAPSVAAAAAARVGSAASPAPPSSPKPLVPRRDVNVAALVNRLFDEDDKVSKDNKDESAGATSGRKTLRAYFPRRISLIV